MSIERLMKLNEDPEKLNSIIEEYKMSMGGCFFNNVNNKNHEFELKVIENTIENHLLDINKLMSIYDNLSDIYKREFFRKVILELIKNQEEVIEK